MKKYLSINSLLLLFLFLALSAYLTSTASALNHAVINTLSPSTAVAAGPGFTLTVRGSNFSTSSVVLWKNTQRPTTFHSSNRLTATILSSEIAVPGTAAVSVVTKGSYSNSLGFIITSAPVAVSISPASASLLTGGTQQFSATVSGTTNTSVTWSATGGTVSSSGMYTAPGSAGTYTVTAKSVANSTKAASATVTVSTATAGLNYYVSTTGNDSSNGSAASPWRTIGHADSAAQPGWIIHVAPGVYNGSVTTNASGTLDKHVVFVSDTKWGAVIDQGNSGSTGIAWLQNGDYTEINGFEVRNSQYSGIGQHCSHCWVLNNKIHDVGGVCGSNGGAGITGESYSTSDQHIIGNLVYNIGPNHNGAVRCNSIQGIYPTTPLVEVKNNLIMKISGDGISSWHYATQMTVINNTVMGSLDAGILIGNNSSSNTTSTISNNIVHKNPNCGICEGGTIGTNIYTNNHVVGNGYNWQLLNGNTHSGDVTASSPLFVNDTGDQTGNYHLTSTSPDIDMGTATFAPPLDFAGGLRPQGADFDIGSYEYGAAAGSWPYSY